MNHGVNGTAEKVEALLKAHNEGRTVSEIAKELEISRGGVKTVLDTLSTTTFLAEEDGNYFIQDWKNL